MAEIHRIGEPENESEALAIRTLAEQLPDTFRLYHNFELTTGRGLPYEYDLAVVGEFSVWHVEIKNYGGLIRGDRHLWKFPNGYTFPSPIRLANRKTRILGTTLKSMLGLDHGLFVDTMVLITDRKARLKIRDEQSEKVVLLKDAPQRFIDRSLIPVKTKSIKALHGSITHALTGGVKPRNRIKRVGLYDIVERINQTDTRTVFLADHRFIRTRPRTILKAFHFDVYATDDEKERQIQSIFHDQDALRLIGSHPNIIDTGDMFAWQDDQFVLPTEYIEDARTLLDIFEHHEESNVSWSEKARWISRMGRGLDYAHRHGVIHRDLQPLNIVVAPDGVCKLVNFDLSLILDSPDLGESRPDHLRQRFHRGYVAPEVWKQPRSADPRSDIYSLGILFYELITGTRPYEDVESWVDSDGPAPVDCECLKEALVAPGVGLVDSPDDACAVIARMTNRDPDQRYGSVAEVLEDLAIIEP